MPAASQISRTDVASYPFMANRSRAVLRIRSADVAWGLSMTLLLRDDLDR